MTAHISFLLDTTNKIMLVKQTNKKNCQIVTGVLIQISRYLNNLQQIIREYQTTQNFASYFNSQLIKPSKTV